MRRRWAVNHDPEHPGSKRLSKPAVAVAVVVLATVAVLSGLVGGLSNPAVASSRSVILDPPTTTRKLVILIPPVKGPPVLVAVPNSTTTTVPPPPPCGAPGTPPCNPCSVTRSRVTTCPTSTTSPPAKDDPVVVIDLGGATTTTVPPTTAPATTISDAVKLDATGASFGEIGVGTTSAPRPVSLNNRDTIPVRLGKIVVPAPFAAVPGGSCGSQPFLAAKSTCTVNVVLKPTAPGPQVAAVTFDVLVPAGTVVVQARVDGSGGAARLEFTPGALDLGQGDAGTKATGTATLKNTGTSAVKVVKIVPQKKSTEVTVIPKPCVGATLPPGGSCVVTVNFTPKAGIRTLQLLATGSRGETAVLQVKRRGLFSGFTLAPALADFGVLKIGTPSAPKRFTVKNVGETTLKLVVPSLLGPNVSELKILATTCGASLAPKATCTIDVVAAGVSPGSKSATLKVVSAKLFKLSALRARIPAPTTTRGSTTPTVTTPIPLTAVPTTIPPTTTPTITYQPTLRMSPAVGTIGRVTIAEGRGFPANTDVELRWLTVPGSWRATTDANGEFRVPVLVRTDEPIGGRVMTVVDQPSSFSGVTAPYLVQLPTFQPSRSGRNLDR